MFRLPENTPSFYESALSSLPSEASLREVLTALAEESVKSLGALDYIVSCRFEPSGRPGEKLLFAGTRREGAPADFSALFSQLWQETSAEQYIGRELERKLASISYSAFSWPYPIKSSAPAREVRTGLTLPKSYSLFVPFSSGLIVSLDSEGGFFGYVGLLFDEFPELRDERVQLIISLPALLSEIVSAYHRRSAKQAGEWGNAYAHDVKHYLLMTLELFRSARSGDPALREPAVAKLERLTRQLLLVTSSKLLADRDSGGALRVNPVRLNFTELLEESCAEIEPLFAAAKMSLIKQFSAEIPEILVDPAIFPSVIFNLLDNALKYSSDSGEVFIRAGVRDGAVHLEVEDRGIGVPAAERQKIFERHYRASNSAGIAGDGLGLYLVKRIVTAHGGLISFRAGESKGTVFRIELPIRGDDG